MIDLPDYLSFLLDNIAIRGDVSILNLLVCAGYLSYCDGAYRKNWKTEFYKANIGGDAYE